MRSIINTGVDIMEGDELVTLSTCVGDFPDARLVIVARRIRADEEAAVDPEGISVNAEALHPQIYYDKKPALSSTQSGTSSSVPSTSSGSTVSSDEASSSDISSNTSSTTSNTEAASSETTTSN